MSSPNRVCFDERPYERIKSSPFSSSVMEQFESRQEYHWYLFASFVPIFDEDIECYPDNVLDWIVEVEQFFERYYIPTLERVQHIVRRLTGRAHQMCKHFQAWPQIKRCLKGNFLPRYMNKDLNDAYLTCRQGNHTVKEYAQNFERLSLITDFCETELQRMDRFLNGLHPSIEEQVSRESVWNFKEAVKLALKIEIWLKRLRFRKQQVQEVISPASQQIIVPQTPENVSSLKDVQVDEKCVEEKVIINQIIPKAEQSHPSIPEIHDFHVQELKGTKEEAREVVLSVQKRPEKKRQEKKKVMREKTIIKIFKFCHHHWKPIKLGGLHHQIPLAFKCSFSNFMELEDEFFSKKGRMMRRSDQR